MGLQERLQEIRTSHGQHTGRKCEVCWMLAELDRQNADTRAAAGDAAVARAESTDRALRMAEIERDNALADVDMWRKNAATLARNFQEAKDDVIADRLSAASELAAAKKVADGANDAHRSLGIQYMQLRTKITAALAKMAALPQIPRVRQLAADLRAALGEL